MIAENDVKNVDSFEEYTLYSLERSSAGLQAMMNEVRACGEAMQRSEINIERVRDLAEQLQGFDQFEMNVSTIFGIDRAACVVASGSLEDAMKDFREGLKAFAKNMEAMDVAAAGRDLCVGIADAISRIDEHIPSIKSCVEQEITRNAEPSSV